MKEEKEEKKQKRKQKIADIKTFLSDKRNKALVKLIIYAIFFTIVIIFIRVTNAKNQRYKELEDTNQVEILPDTITSNLTKLNKNKNYQFIINYKIQSNSIYNYSFTGIMQDGLLQLNVDDKVYSFDGSSFYEVIDNNNIYTDNILINNTILFTPDKIYKYLLKANYQYKKEDISKLITINSNLKISDFDLINNNITTNDDLIIIETMEKTEDDLIISLDLTNYYKNSDSSITNYIVTIEFKY